jgi:sugar phosphate permease
MTVPLGSSARHRLVQYGFSLAVITYLDRVCISAAAPFMMRDLDLSVLQMGIVFSAFTLAYSIFEVPTGWMADVWGARRILARIVLWWSAFTALTGAVQSFASLVTVRFLFGAGEAGAFPSMLRAFSRWVPARERGRANGLLFLGSRLGGAVAPGLAFLFITLWGWRATFVIFGAVGLVWVMSWQRWFRDDPADHPEVGRDELAWIRQDDVRADSARGAESIASAGRATRDIPWRAILTSPNVLAICGMYFGFGYGLYFYFTWLPTYLTRELGFTTLQGGFFAGLPFVLAGIANIAGGQLTDRLAATKGLKIARCALGSTAFLTCAGLLTAATIVTGSLLKAMLLALALAAADFALSACWAVCLDVGKDYAGIITGMMNTFGNLGGAIGPLVVGYAVERWQSWNVPFYIAAAIYAAGAILWLAIDPTEQIGASRAGGKDWRVGRVGNIQ